MSWSTLFKSVGAYATILSAVLAVLIAGGVAVRQWVEKPIAIGSFTVVNDADKTGINAVALADELKAQISKINADSGDLFESRKLVDNACLQNVRAISGAATERRFYSEWAERQDDATQRRRLRSTVKRSCVLPVTLAHAALVPAL